MKLNENLLNLLAACLTGTLASGADPQDAVEDAVEAALLVKEELRKLNGSGVRTPRPAKKSEDDLDA